MTGPFIPKVVPEDGWFARSDGASIPLQGPPSVWGGGKDVTIFVAGFVLPCLVSDQIGFYLPAFRRDQLPVIVGPTGNWEWPTHTKD